jgi:hypothetical protein
LFHALSTVIALAGKLISSYCLNQNLSSTVYKLDIYHKQ